MYCSKCGSAIADGSTVCSQCGQSTALAPVMMTGTAPVVTTGLPPAVVTSAVPGEGKAVVAVLPRDRVMSL